MNVKRNIIEIDEELCNGCGQCIVSCAEGALKIVDGKAKLVADRYCDGLGACLGECPTGALKVVQRDAEEFDEEAVEHHLKALQEAEKPLEQTLPCGCPSAQIRTFSQPDACQRANEPVSRKSAASALSNWPVQIRLIPAKAPFLKNADLLVASDCSGFALASFHEHFLKGKVLMVGCPKFDDAQSYVEKFAEIFSVAAIKTVTVLVMEVPCCQGLPLIVQRGMELAGKSVPMERVIVSAQGEVLKTEKLVA